MFDIIISGGMVIDGTGSPARRADIGIRHDTLAAIGDLQGAVARETVTAHGMHVCPGFIDVHAHSDFNLLAVPPGRSKVLQGVTTEVCGNCGMSAAPLQGAVRDRRAASCARLGVGLSWSSLREYAARFEHAPLLCNVLPLVGHGNIRGAIIGYDNRLPDAEDMRQMTALLERELEAGAWGLSTGLIYPPGVYAQTEEIIGLCRAAARHNGIYTTHMRSEGERVLEAIAEALRIGREAAIPVQISHLKTLGRQNWHSLPEMFRLIEQARDTGLRVAADRYPYTAAATDLDAVLPVWVCEGGNAAELERLKNPAIRERLRQAVRHTERGLADEIIISRVASEKNRHLEGMPLGAAAQSRHQGVIDALLDLLIEEELQVDAVFFSMSEDNLQEILKKDYVMIGSDASVWDCAGVLGRGKPHPRAFGTFPRVLGKYVREERLLGLEEAVRKMTGQVAETLGIPERGFIRQGWKADLVLFDFDTIRDTATYEAPQRFPEGIERVMVNGHWVVAENRITGARPGKVLLRQ